MLQSSIRVDPRAHRFFTFVVGSSFEQGNIRADNGAIHADLETGTLPLTETGAIALSAHFKPRILLQSLARALVRQFPLLLPASR
jgi:hypothetical protein